MCDAAVLRIVESRIQTAAHKRQASTVLLPSRHLPQATTSRTHTLSFRKSDADSFLDFLAAASR